MQLHFAPIQGYTDTIFLSEYCKLYEPLDVCYTPFIRIEKGAPRRQDIARILDPDLKIPSLTPQIIFRDVNEFKTLVDSIKSIGFANIDLNLGCPYPMQTRKGRGAAMISNVNIMSEVCDLIKGDASTSYSIKMRLGLKDPDEWRLVLPLLNNTPLRHVTLHPRTASQMYSGDIDHESASRFIDNCKHPVIFNGEVRTPSDIDHLAERYPNLAGVMIGRGLIMRPSLAAEWNSREEWPADARLSKHITFYESLLKAYSGRLCGEAQILQKMKPYWEYLEPAIGRKAAKAIAKASSLAQYEKAVATITF